MSTINITISHKGSSYSLSVPSLSKLESLQSQLERLTNIPISMQKLLYKGKQPSSSSSNITLEESGIKDGMKIVLLGSTKEEIIKLKKVENDIEDRNRVLARRVKKPAIKVRSTASASSSSPSLQYRFHSTSPLQHLPNPAQAQALLTRLSQDQAILHVMQTHRFSVGLLTELAPHEHPGLLGLNVNAGQAIKLRLRTNAYDGFRLYSDVRRVLVHELTHNVWGDHDNNFKTLNSQLNREVLQYETSKREGAHSLLGSSDVYEPEVSLGDTDSRTHTLGGDRHGQSESSTFWEGVEERRKRVLDAVMRRLRREEEEVEEACGTTSAKTQNQS